MYAGDRDYSPAAIGLEGAAEIAEELSRRVEKAEQTLDAALAAREAQAREKREKTESAAEAEATETLAAENRTAEENPEKKE